MRVTRSSAKMASQQFNTGEKRKRESGEAIPSKRRMLKSGKEERQHEKAKKEREVEVDREQEQKQDIEPATTLQLIDINDHCLLDIFDRLSLIDLLNVADSNKRLKHVAEMVFKRKFVKFLYIRLDPKRKYELFDHRIMIKDLKTCLQLLRCFGHMISMLTLNCANSEAKHCAKIICYLNEYYGENCYNFLCIENLKLTTHLIDGIEKPFTRIQTLKVQNCHFENGFSFAKYFPCMSDLNVDSNVYDNPKIIQAHFPTLREITIGIEAGKNITELLRLNQQLTKVTISKGYKPAFIHYIDENIPRLTAFKLDNFPQYNLNDVEIVHLRNIKNIEIFVRCWSTLKSIPFSFDKLEKFAIKGLCLNQTALDAIAEMRHLKELRLSIGIDGENFLEKLLLLENVLANVKLMDLRWRGYIPIERILHFLKRSQAIETFSFMAKTGKIMELKSHLDADKWELERYAESVTITSCKKTF